MSKVKIAPKELDERNCTTHNSRKSSAEICRINNWVAGTRLIGDEGYGPCILRITAIGERALLAASEDDGYEINWTLDCRDWHPVNSKAGKWILFDYSNVEDSADKHYEELKKFGNGVDY